MSLLVERAGPKQAAALAQLHGECFIGGWDEKSMASLLASPGSAALLARDSGGRPTGFLVYRRAASEAELLTIGVRHSRRRQGVARTLVGAMIDALRGGPVEAIFLEVGADNDAAKALYRHFGFTKVGRRARYYRHADGDRDALVMKKKLP